ncbi:MAG: ABC transporter substrate-binding protein [Dehalococcoidales bacterium]|nr:ABC transporter substrate-binding protein [Dehalococcoidales bacterium]
MKSRIVWMLMGGLIAVVLVIVSCKAATPEETQETTTGPTGSAIVAVAQLGAQPIDPDYVVGSPEYTSSMPRILLGNLLYTDPVSGALTPGMATSWEVAPDLVTWTFHIREGVTFPLTGNTVTAHDWEYSWKKIQAGQCTPAMKTREETTFSNVWAEDDYTLKVKLNYQNAILASNSSQLGILGVRPPVDSKYCEEVGYEAYKDKPSNIGYYKFKEQKLSEYTILEAFDDKFTYAQPWGPLQASVKEINLQIVPESTTRLALLKTGKVDIMTEVLGAAIPEVKTLPDIKVYTSKGLDIIELIVSDYLFQDEPSAMLDKRCRQAAAYAIDRNAIAQKLYYGAAVEQKMPDVFSWLPFADTTIVGYPYNPEKAKALLKEAGYPDGFSTVITARPQHMDIAQAVAQYWEAIGIDVDLRPIEAAVYLREATEKKLRGTFVTTVPVRLEPVTVFNEYYRPGGTWAFSTNTELLAKIDDCLATPDVNTRMEKNKALCRWVTEELPSRIPLIERQLVYACGPRVTQFVPGLVSYWAHPELLKIKD